MAELSFRKNLCRYLGMKLERQANARATKIQKKLVCTTMYNNTDMIIILYTVRT